MSQTNDTTTPAAQPQTTREDELLGVIADVEKQLSALKNFRAERDDTRQRLQEREKQLIARQQELETLGQTLETERQSLEARRARIEQGESELASRREKIDTDWKALEQAQSESEQERAKVVAELEHQTKLLIQREERLSESAAALSRQREELETAAQSLSDREKALKKAQADAERALAENEQLRSACEAAQSLAKTREEDLASAQAQAQELMAQISAAKGEAVDLRRDLDRSAEAQSSLIGELQAREERLNQQDEKIRSLTSDLQNRTSAASQLKNQLEDFKRQLIERDGRIQDLSQKLAAATAKLREVSQQITQQAEIIGQAEQLERELEERQARIDALTKELTELRSHLQAAEASAGAGAAATEQTQQQIRDMEERIATLEDALRTAHDELVGAIDENKKLRQHVAEAARDRGAREVPADIGEAVTRRWSRLRHMRHILREQTAKLNQAGEALRVRYQECEQILAQREALTAGHAALLDARRKLEKMQARAARAKSWATLFYAIASIALLAGLSWLIAGEVAPATYAARATIAADLKTGEAVPDQIREWQRYHESLMEDPSLLEVAAERMQRRGIESLGTPGALDAFLKASATQVSAEPGKLTIEVRGPGQAKTARVLDTYIAALCSEANAGRDRRTDGLATTVIETASAGAGPIEDDRLLYGAGIFGGGLALSLVFVMLVWKRLAMAKQRFEEEQLIDATLAESSWRQAAEGLPSRA